MAIAIHDTTYLIDFSVKHIVLDDAMKMGADMIADYVISEVEKYEHENFSKFIGAGLPTTVKYMSPTLCSRLWLELDIVPIVMRPDDESTKGTSFWDVKRVDEQADSMARKCIMYVAPVLSLSPFSSVSCSYTLQELRSFIGSGSSCRLPRHCPDRCWISSSSHHCPKPQGHLLFRDLGDHADVRQEAAGRQN